MDQLPELESDADVDALMARLRARLAVATPQGQAAGASPELSGNALRDFLVVQEEYASAVHRTMTLIAESLEELQNEKPSRRRSNTR